MDDVAWIGTQGDEVAGVKLELRMIVVGLDVMHFQIGRPAARDAGRLFG
jgi:hypothetical protein